MNLINNPISAEPPSFLQRMREQAGQEIFLYPHAQDWEPTPGGWYSPPPAFFPDDWESWLKVTGSKAVAKKIWSIGAVPHPGGPTDRWLKTAGLGGLDRDRALGGSVRDLPQDFANVGYELGPDISLSVARIVNRRLQWAGAAILITERIHDPQGGVAVLARSGPVCLLEGYAEPSFIQLGQRNAIRKDRILVASDVKSAIKGCEWLGYQGALVASNLAHFDAEWQPPSARHIDVVLSHPADVAWTGKRTGSVTTYLRTGDELKILTTARLYP